MHTCTLAHILALSTHLPRCGIAHLQILLQVFQKVKSFNFRNFFSNFLSLMCVCLCVCVGTTSYKCYHVIFYSLLRCHDDIIPRQTHHYMLPCSSHSGLYLWLDVKTMLYKLLNSNLPLVSCGQDLWIGSYWCV